MDFEGRAQGAPEELAKGASRVEDYEYFEKRIRPLLVERCYECHSSRSAKLKGGLRLDSREGMRRGGNSGKPAVVPGAADRSLLMEAVRYGNAELQMPPKEKGRLSDAEVADLAGWIQSGAPDPRTSAEEAVLGGNPAEAGHWAFEPPRRPNVPGVKNREWPRSPVDAFILARLEAAGLEPSQDADRRTLLRRVTYDLTGLPPTIEEVEAFERDAAPGAYERVVERLLTSPRYGERWGRYWLDVARYADTKGYVYSDREEGRFVHSQTYRHWVIGALNRDMPYDRFLRLQLAADQELGVDLAGVPDWLPASSGSLEARSDAGLSDLAALGYLTLGRRFLGVIHDIIDDRIDVVMRGTQGLTVGCARCHDHKYDPISMRDYYGLYGVFQGSYERTLWLESRQSNKEDAETFSKGLRERVGKLEETFAAKRDQLLDRLRTQAPEYLEAVLSVATLPTEEFYEIRDPKDLNPTIVRQWHAFLEQCSRDKHTVFGPWSELASIGTHDFAKHASAVMERWSSEVGTGEAAGGKGGLRMNELVLRSLREGMLNSMGAVARAYGKLLSEVDRQWRDAVKAAKEGGQEAPRGLEDADREALRQVLYGAGSPITLPKGAIGDLEWFFDEKNRVELNKAQKEIEGWILKHREACAYAVVLQDRPAQRNARIFLRGNPANKGEEAPRRFLEVLSRSNPEPFRVGSGRLELARAIASAENPLTARVMVNRVWRLHFGAGLVKSTSDFGTRCDRPSHPELLDWLALRFMDQGWSVKRLHRWIVLSRAYQQRSDGERMDTAARMDPENRLLWRMNSQRLDFEGMRDSLLAVSGELEERLEGGPSMLFAVQGGRRRTVYGMIDRQFLPGVLRLFDYANPDMHSPARGDTTVPQQALFFMNSPFAMDRARALAAGLDEGADVARSIRDLYRRVYQRAPTPDEVDWGEQFVRQARVQDKAEPPKPVESSWQYGHGAMDEKAGRVLGFTKLPHFTGQAWQGGESWPDAKLGWVQLTAEGGHAGNDLQHAAIRRWVAPLSGTVGIKATLKHEHKEGDGIHAAVVCSRGGVLGQWTVHDGKAETHFEKVPVVKGDTIDFVVDIRGNLNSDDFIWVPVITKLDQESGGRDPQWDAKFQFGGPEEKPRRLNVWESYAQVLLQSNEFLFVD